MKIVTAPMWTEIDENDAEKLNGGRRGHPMKNASSTAFVRAFKSVVIQIIGNNNNVNIDGFNIS